MVASRFLTKLQTIMARARVLVVGDVMLDSYIYGLVERISQEAPIPVLSQTGATEYRPGGAANVACNIMAMGAGVSLVGLMGNDAPGQQLEACLKKLAKELSNKLSLDDQLYDGFFIKQSDRPTTEKTRYIANKQQMLRLDRENIRPIDKKTADELLAVIEKKLPDVGAVILSDYGKGLLTDSFLQDVIKMVKGKKLPVVVDPKGNDFKKYRGADYITPNRQELHQATKWETKTTDQVIAASYELIASVGLQGVLATRSEEGLSLIRTSPDKKNIIAHFKTDAREVFDVAGAGDTVVAIFAAGLAAGLPSIFAARLANAGGGVVVGKRGTAEANLTEIIAMIYSSIEHGEYNPNEGEALAKISQWKKMGKKIVVANGCFDMLHDGHVSLLQQARQQGDELVVLINSDDSVARLKGASRPFQPCQVRADALLGLAEVSQVIPFEEDTPADIIKKIKPDVLVKGDDYAGKDIVGAKDSGRVYLAKLQNGFSTSNILKDLI